MLYEVITIVFTAYKVEGEINTDDFSRITSYNVCYTKLLREFVHDRLNITVMAHERLLQQLTEPLLAPARKLIPPMGGLDFSRITSYNVCYTKLLRT